MGVSTDAVVAYGHDLGGPESWKIQNTGEYGALDLPWYDPYSGAGFVEQAKKRLLAGIAGFTETNRQAEGFYERETEAWAQVGVGFERHCSHESPMYVLASHVITVYRGHSKVLDLQALVSDPVTHGWDLKLQAALSALGITPAQAKPGWVLVSYWG